MSYSASAGVHVPCPRCESERQRVIEGGFDEARGSPRPIEAADHASLVYDSADAIAPFCARFLTDGIDTGRRVVAAVQEDLRQAIAALLAPDAELAIEWEDPRLVYGDFEPDRVAARYEAIIAADERGATILAGLDPETAKTVDPAEFARYEAKAHEIINSYGATVVCLYDERALPPEFLEVSAARHGLTVEGGATRRNERFEYEPV
jgi:hypothetical protein